MHLLTLDIITMINACCYLGDSTWTKQLRQGRMGGMEFCTVVLCIVRACSVQRYHFDIYLLNWLIPHAWILIQCTIKTTIDKIASIYDKLKNDRDIILAIHSMGIR